MAGEPKSKEQSTKLEPAELNEKLMLSLIRQHELNELLQAEIVARKKAEEALINSEKLASVGRMAAVLAHEINNPLESVTNLLFIAQTSPGLPEPARGYLEIADGELKRIAHITRQTLGFYRESATPSTFPLTTLLTSIIDLLQAKITASRAIVQIECDPKLEVTAFQGELRQVFSNLLRNSLDAVPDGGRITLRATPLCAFDDRPPSVRISVSDNGYGISQIALASLFRPFFTTKGLTGNGLGLWVSKQLIEKHGGAIQVRSRTNGRFQGTTFLVVLPVKHV
jgi:two-component system NtrC family sensor kinase